ncbi:MAG TPA: lytic transglycosylase domain-containing protein, partial [Pyrinomonadaceae bacterium]
MTQRTGSVQDGLALKNISQPSPDRLSMSVGSNLGGFTTGDVLIDSYIVESSIRYNIDPLLIYAQMHQESSFKRKAISYKGASGLMQLMPATARRFGVTSIFDPKQNIDAGIKYMRWLLNTFNQDLRLALAGYNAGEGAVMKYGWQIPP